LGFFNKTAIFLLKYPIFQIKNTSQIFSTVTKFNDEFLKISHKKTQRKISSSHKIKDAIAKLSRFSHKIHHFYNIINPKKLKKYKKSS